MLTSNRWNDAVLVALGANLPGGDKGPQERLERAIGELTAQGLHVTARSRWWRSLAWPDPAQPAFLNGVAIVETALPPEGVLAAVLEVERAFGRIRGAPNAPRTLDLDVIAYGRVVRDRGGLVLPHPRAHERRFVMGPLAELAPDWVHPVLGLTASALIASALVGRDANPIG